MSIPAQNFKIGILIQFIFKTVAFRNQNFGNFYKPFGNSELQALFESGEELEYLAVPVIRDTTDQMGNVVEFEESCVDRLYQMQNQNV